MGQDPLDNQGPSNVIDFGSRAKYFGHTTDTNPLMQNVVAEIAGIMISHQSFAARLLGKSHHRFPLSRKPLLKPSPLPRWYHPSKWALLRGILTSPTYKHLISASFRFLLAACGLSLLGLANPAQADQAELACSSVQSVVDKYARSLPNLESLERLSSFMTARAMNDLAAHLKVSNAARRGSIYQAIGRARHSESLRLLLAIPRPEASSERLSLALGLLSLGDGTRSATITAALKLGTVAERRAVSHALAKMKQVRPYRMLKPALKDVDDVVRLAAVTRFSRRPLSSLRTHLLALSQSDKIDVRREAAQLLVRGRYRVNYKIILDQPEPMRSQMYVIGATRRSSQITRSLKKDVFSKDRLRRSASLAAMAHVMPFKRFRRVKKRLDSKFGKGIAPELAMTLAIYDEDDGWAALDKLDANELERAVEVLMAYVGAGPRWAGLSVGHAARFANRLEAWMTTGILSGAYERRLLKALFIMEPDVSINVARKRLEFKDGGGLQEALRLLSLRGEVSDVPKIIGVLEKPLRPETRISALLSASRLCRY